LGSEPGIAYVRQSRRQELQFEFVLTGRHMTFALRRPHRRARRVRLADFLTGPRAQSFHEKPSFRALFCRMRQEANKLYADARRKHRDEFADQSPCMPSAEPRRVQGKKRPRFRESLTGIRRANRKSIFPKECSPHRGHNRQSIRTTVVGLPEKQAGLRLRVISRSTRKSRHRDERRVGGQLRLVGPAFVCISVATHVHVGGQHRRRSIVKLNLFQIRACDPKGESVSRGDRPPMTPTSRLLQRRAWGVCLGDDAGSPPTDKSAPLHRGQGVGCLWP